MGEMGPMHALPSTSLHHPIHVLMELSLSGSEVTAMLSLSADARKEEDHISALPLDIYGVLRHRRQRHPERVRGGQDDGQKNKISSTNDKGQLSKEIEKMVQEEIENPSMLQ